MEGMYNNYNKWTASLYDAHRERAREREGERETGGIHSDSQMGILVVLSTTDYYNKREREIRRGRGRERYTNIHTMSVGEAAFVCAVVIFPL